MTFAFSLIWLSWISQNLPEMTCFSTYFMKPGATKGMKYFLCGVLSADSRHMLLLENLGTDLTGDPWSNEGREHGWSWGKKAPGDLTRNVFRRGRTCEACDQTWALRFKVAALNVTVELFWAAGQSTESRHSPRSMLHHLNRLILCSSLWSELIRTFDLVTNRVQLVAPL